MNPKTLKFRANGDANSYALLDGDTGKWVLSLLANGEMHTPEQIAVLDRLAQCWNTAPEFAGLPLRKLNDLMALGMRVNGVSLEITQEDGTVKRAACTTGGMVLWWQPEQARVIAPSVRSVMQQALEALETIALAGMSGSGQESPEAITEWHARQAWRFISIAARQLGPLREALALPAKQLDDINVADMAAAQPDEPVQCWKHGDEPRRGCAWCDKQPAPPAAQTAEPVASPTAGMRMAQRIMHVGGRNNAAGYVEFGSIQAVEALVRQALRDLPPTDQPAEPVECQYGNGGYACCEDGPCKADAQNNAALAAPQPEQQEPAATVIKRGADRDWMSERLGHLPDGIYSLYLNPPVTKAPAPPAAQPAPQQAVQLDRDTVAVNLMRLAGLDKHKARECAEIVMQVLAAAHAITPENAPTEAPGTPE